MAAKDYTNVGSTFSRLTVIGAPFKDKFGIYKVRCKCSCGVETEPSCRQLLIGQTKSCGCLRVDSGRARTVDPRPGDRFGMLTILQAIDRGAGSDRSFSCRCDCGNDVIMKIKLFRSSKTQSCGCLRAKVNRDKNPIPVGKKFGRLTVIEEAERVGRDRCVAAKCECGAITRVTLNNLRSGHSVSCGCLRLEGSHATHGHTRKGKASRTYAVYRDMLTRCLNSNYPEFYLYGGRGIKICERWKTFENFLADMGEKPRGLTIERIDVNGDYEPGNCKWATDEEQANNKRNNIFIEFSGKRMTVAQWARELGILDKTIYQRLYKGWPPERALMPTR